MRIVNVPPSTTTVIRASNALAIAYARGYDAPLRMVVIDVSKLPGHYHATCVQQAVETMNRRKGGAARAIDFISCEA
jgi:hypothetical protein